VGDSERLQDVEPDLGELKLSESEQEQRAKEDETISDSKTCPECGAPIENLRATCPQCGYQYQAGDYDDEEAGNEFLTGSELDDQGKEIVDESGRVASERKDQS